MPEVTNVIDSRILPDAIMPTFVSPLRLTIKAALRAFRALDYHKNTSSRANLIPIWLNRLVNEIPDNLPMTGLVTPIITGIILEINAALSRLRLAKKTVKCAHRR